MQRNLFCNLGHLILFICPTAWIISRSASCWIDLKESLECSCQVRKLLIESEGFDMCGSNGQLSGRLESESLL